MGDIITVVFPPGGKKFLFLPTSVWSNPVFTPAAGGKFPNSRDRARARRGLHSPPRGKYAFLGRRIFPPQKPVIPPPVGEITFFPVRGRSEFRFRVHPPPRWGKISQKPVSTFIWIITGSSPPRVGGKCQLFQRILPPKKPVSSPRVGKIGYVPQFFRHSGTGFIPTRLGKIRGYVHNFFGIRDGSSPRGGENIFVFGPPCWYLRFIPTRGEIPNFTTNFGHKFRFIPTRWGKYNFLSPWGIAETVHPHAVGKIFSAGTQ